MCQKEQRTISFQYTYTRFLFITTTIKKLNQQLENEIKELKLKEEERNNNNKKQPTNINNSSWWTSWLVFERG